MIDITPCVPVIMYHSIRERRNLRWVYSHLTLELSFFIQQLEYFKRSKYYIASLDEVLAFKRGEIHLPEKTISITFDDGYLDNWVYAFPLLKKYGFRATIFVSPEFIQLEQAVRPTLEDVWAGKCRQDDLVDDGFLSWEELRRLQASGLIDIQSHSMTHTFYPVSDEIVDFHHPGDAYIWLQWNARPTQKSSYMSDEYIDPVPVGTPVYKSEQAIIARRVQENGQLSKYLAKYVERKGENTFFGHSNWRTELFRVAAEYKREHSVAYECETESEYYVRLIYELQESRRIIENQLDKSVTILCWPNGGWNDFTHQLALDAGYEATTAKGGQNVFNSSDPTRIMRTGLPQISNSKTVNYLFISYILNTRRNIWPYSYVREKMVRLGITKALNSLLRMD